MTKAALKNLRMWERALLFQYVIDKGLPHWANGRAAIVFARLMNISRRQADAAFERAHHAGYLDRV